MVVLVGQADRPWEVLVVQVDPRWEGQVVQALAPGAHRGLWALEDQAVVLADHQWVDLVALDQVLGVLEVLLDPWASGVRVEGQVGQEVPLAPWDSEARVAAWDLV